MTKKVKYVRPGRYTSSGFIPAKQHTARTRPALWTIVLIIALLALVSYTVHSTQIFEDGSFIILNTGGCIPFGLCNL